MSFIYCSQVNLFRRPRIEMRRSHFDDPKWPLIIHFSIDIFCAIRLQLSKHKTKFGPITPGSWTSGERDVIPGAMCRVLQTMPQDPSFKHPYDYNLSDDFFTRKVESFITISLISHFIIGIIVFFLMNIKKLRSFQGFCNEAL